MIKLKPKYDGAKSFYNKARVREDNGDMILISYCTDVCTITKEGKVIINELYSPTTIRHIVEFLKQNNTLWGHHYPDINTDQINTTTVRKFALHNRQSFKGHFLI